MTTAVLALIVAGVSLTWNIVSTVLNWRRESPRIKIEIGSVRYGSDAEGWIIGTIEIRVTNRGGSDTAITTSQLFLSAEPTKNRRNYLGRVLQYSASQVPFGKQGEWLIGPDLPAILPARHSQSWHIDMSYMYVESRTPPYQIPFFMETSDGKKHWIDIPMNERDHTSAVDLHKERTSGNRRKLVVGKNGEATLSRPTDQMQSTYKEVNPQKPK